MLGLPLSTCTAALVATTAVPVWHNARRELPCLFASGAATTALGAGLLAWRGRRSRTWATAAGLLMNLGAVATRWSVYRAGFASAAHPKYTIAPRRERIERGETAGPRGRGPASNSRITASAHQRLTSGRPGRPSPPGRPRS